MKTFILVLIAYNYTNGVAITSIPGFNSLEECAIARDIATHTFTIEGGYKEARATCIMQTVNTNQVAPTK